MAKKKTATKKKPKKGKKVLLDKIDHCIACNIKELDDLCGEVADEVIIEIEMYQIFRRMVERYI